MSLLKWRRGGPKGPPTTPVSDIVKQYMDNGGIVEIPAPEGGATYTIVRKTHTDLGKITPIKHNAALVFYRRHNGTQVPGVYYKGSNYNYGNDRFGGQLNFVPYVTPNWVNPDSHSGMTEEGFVATVANACMNTTKPLYSIRCGNMIMS